mgnify:CR=1 FL=1|jgi:hypothetical protein|nr:MAG TPA: hypothetical protein [Caudoviricetes sp.]
MTFETIIKVVLPFATGVAFGVIASRKYNEQKALDKYQEDLNEAEKLKKKYEYLIKEASELDDDVADVKEETPKDEVYKDDNSKMHDDEEIYNEYYESNRKPLPHVELRSVLPESVKNFTDDEIDKIRCHTPIYMGNSGCYLDENGDDIFEIVDDEGLEFHTVYPGFIDDFLGYDIINGSYDDKINKLYNQYDEELPIDDVGEDAMAAFLNKYGDCMQPIFVVNKYQGIIYSIRNGSEREYFDNFWDESLEVPTENAYKRCLMGIKGDTNLYEEE